MNPVRLTLTQGTRCEHPRGAFRLRVNMSHSGTEPTVPPYDSRKDQKIYAWGDCPGFVRESENGRCICVWDDGNYITVAVCYREDIPLLKKVHPIEN